MKTYTVQPLSAAVGRQLVDGFRDAMEIARDIARRNDEIHGVIVSNGTGTSWTVPPLFPGDDGPEFAAQRNGRTR